MLHRRSLFFALPLALLLLPAAAGADDGSGEAAPSLYERLGGLAPISVVISEFVDELVVDETLNANPAIDAARETVPAAYLKYHVTAMVCQATGGPCTYTGRGMHEAHAHLNITEAEWSRMADVLTGVLNRHGVPEQEQGELMAILGSTKGDIVTAGM